MSELDSDFFLDFDRDKKLILDKIKKFVNDCESNNCVFDSTIEILSYSNPKKTDLKKVQDFKVFDLQRFYKSSEKVYGIIIDFTYIPSNESKIFEISFSYSSNDYVEYIPQINGEEVIKQVTKKIICGEI